MPVSRERAPGAADPLPRGASRARAGELDGPGLDAQRRRLYTADATAEDVRRYRAALADRPGDVSPSTVRRPRAVGAVLIAVLLAAAATALLATGPERAPAPAATGTGDAVAVPFSARAAFVRSLGRGGSAGLAQYFFAHPQARPPQLTTLTRAATEEHDGTGTATVRLGPSAAADAGGRLTVILTLAADGTAGWAAVRPAVRTDHATYQQVVAAGSDALSAGAPVSRTVRYTGDGARTLRVRAPAGVRWDALVVFSD